MLAEVFPVAIPLHRRDGSIRAVALVDADHYGDIAQHRWSWSHGYAIRMSWDGKERRKWRTAMHRQVLRMVKGDRREVDHVNGNPLDNRALNLRRVTRRQNGQNLGSHGGSSRYRGVWWAKSNNAWCAMVKLNGERHYLGQFEDEDEAGAVAQRFREEHMSHTNESRYAGVGQ